MKLILPFDTGNGLNYYSAEGRVPREEAIVLPPYAPEKKLGSSNSLDITSGLNVIFGESGSGKTRLITRLLADGFGYQSWGEPDPLPAAAGQQIVGSPEVLVGQLEARLADNDVVILDSLRAYIIGGSGTMKNGLSGAFITSAMTTWHHILRGMGKSVITVVNPQSPRSGPNGGDAYAFALAAVSGSVGTTWETSPEIDSGIRVYRQRNMSAGISFSVDTRFAPSAPRASQQVNVNATHVSISGPGFPDADMRAPFALDRLPFISDDE